MTVSLPLRMAAPGAAAFLTFASGSALAQEASFNASLSAGLRYYPEDGLYAGQSSFGVEAFGEMTLGERSPWAPGA